MPEFVKVAHALACLIYVLHRTIEKKEKQSCCIADAHVSFKGIETAIKNFKKAGMKQCASYGVLV